MGWINVLQAHKDLGIPLPVNLRFCLEGMEESGSEGLDALIEKEAKKGGFLEGVNAVCIVGILSVLYDEFTELISSRSPITTGSTHARLV